MNVIHLNTSSTKKLASKLYFTIFKPTRPAILDSTRQNSSRTQPKVTATMGLLGKKKKDDGDTDSLKEKKGGLFGRSKKEEAASVNPYAQSASSNDPYAAQSGQGPPPYRNGPSLGSKFGTSGIDQDRYRQEKSPVPPGGYGDAPRFQPQGNYGSQAGYGATQNPYGQQRESAPAPLRQGGYGGMGSSMDQPDEGSRNALFGDAPSLYQKQQQTQQDQQLPPDNSQDDPYGASGQIRMPGGYGDDGQGYGAYGDRELTAEEQEEEDVQGTKQEIRFIKQQDVASTRNALRLADQAYQTGAATLDRLGQQGERIHNTEKNLDLASVQNRVATEKAAELKNLNRSMFRPNVNNPFTAKSRREERDAKIMETHRRDREQRDLTRAEAYRSHARQGEFAKELRDPAAPKTRNQASLAERSKYQFEADSEDEQMENEIDDNLDALHGAAGKLKGLASAMGREVDKQNEHIIRITGKTDRVDDEIAMNRARLDRISRRG
ncbi:hypothetical protein LTS18_003246 [Coniosporium uncinatum]|uniref:Uncharacterized protein n=1 Tax=Coniosporium uncinatum TaxID=93489 RepID=A0ACC3DTE1_9PEZI|nr:hypothetical protein LTS18_003246 [Coniosporium uncinatum]